MKNRPGGADRRPWRPGPAPAGPPPPSPLYQARERQPRGPLARWRIGLLLAVPAVAVPVLAIRPPARLGPAGSAVLFGVGLAVAAAALIRGHMIARVLVTVLAAIVGLVGGLAIWFFDRYPGMSELDSAIADVGVPSGFREDRAARDGCDGPIGCSTNATRSYVGAGTADAIVAEMVERLRRACFTDAGPVVGAPSSAVSGTCRRRDMQMSVGVEQQGARVEISFYAVPLE